MTTCVIYCRISLDKTGQMAGVQRQETECRALAERLGLTVDQVYVDNDSSAYSGKRRPQFDAMLAAHPDAIVVWHLDRLVRRIKDLEPVIALDVNIHAVSSGLADLSTPTGRMAARMTTVIAQYESEQKGERQKAMHRQRRAAGRVWWNATTPYGFLPTGETAPGGDEAILALYRGVVQGASLAAVGRTAGISAAGLRDLLLNERNRPIVGDDLWDQVGSILRSRRQGYRHGVGMLTGIAVCGVCGATCRVDGGLYKCKPGGHVTWPKEIVDEAVGVQVADVLAASREEIEAKPADNSAEIVGLTADLMAGHLTPAVFTAALERVMQRVSRPAAPWVPWSLLTEPERHQLCQTLLESVVLAPRGRGVRGTPQLPADALRWRTPPEPRQAAPE